MAGRKNERRECAPNGRVPREDTFEEKEASEGGKSIRWRRKGVVAAMTASALQEAEGDGTA